MTSLWRQFYICVYCCSWLMCHIREFYTSYETKPMERQFVWERGWEAGSQRGPSEGEREREIHQQAVKKESCDKDRSHFLHPAELFSFKPLATFFTSSNQKRPQILCGAARMEWNEVDLVQEFTLEGQCSKIKVRSCRITWDSLQVGTADTADGRCMLTSAVFRLLTYWRQTASLVTFWYFLFDVCQH